jgi:hypothetical protein
MNIDNTYNDDFYTTLNKSSEVASKIYIDHLYQYLKPESVVDVGCGYAAWLKACKQCGSSKLTGIDGAWNNGDYVQSLGFDFISMNLDLINEPIPRHDLAISLEVAEHLKPSSSKNFVKSLTDTSNVVLFSAAFTNQGGTNHINERNPSFWGNMFNEFDYVAFDLFRENFWGDDRVGFWYRQNCFLYCKRNSNEYQTLIDNNVRIINNLDFLDCVHPDLYMTKCGEGIGFAAHASGILPSLFKAMKRIMVKNR